MFFTIDPSPNDFHYADEVNSTIHKIKIKKLFLPEENSRCRTKPITHIMIHYISNVVESPEHPYHIADIYFLLMDYGLSSHYVIDRDGDIFQLVPENRVAYHAGRSSLPNLPFFLHDMNDYSIGIELIGIGTKEEMLPMINQETYDSIPPINIGFTEEQYTALSALIQDIQNRYQSIPKSRWHIIGHEDYAAGRKMDPGQLFDWSKIGY